MNREPQGTSADDKDLVQAAAAGDTAAFDALILRYQDMIYTLCYRYFSDQDEANDCAQESFVKAFHALKNFKGEAQFSTWLHTIALNTCRNRSASLAYRIKKLMTSVTPQRETEDGEQVTEIEGDDPLPEEVLEKRETAQAVQQALRALGETDRSLILLRDLQDFSYDDIAQATGYPLGTVKSKLARARQALKKILERTQR
jgi:RNA polymerase sigma-70 factor (ECF subfamily)